MSSREERAAIAADTIKRTLPLYLANEELQSACVIPTKNYQVEWGRAPSDEDEKDDCSMWSRVRPTVLMRLRRPCVAPS